MRCFIAGLVVVSALLGDRTSAAEPAGVTTLFEDDAEGLLKVLTNPTGDSGEGRPEKAVVFSGTTSIKIIPMQRFSPQIDGWRFQITKAPKPGEYRYLRFAWKADGCAGIMLQMHDAKDWHIRYTAGQNVQGWQSKTVAEKAPPDWALVTIDLFADFGERTLQGIALTALGGNAAYFDHIYLGRTIEDLDRIDATGLRKNGKPIELTPEQLAACWADLGSAQAEKSYRAYWTLVAAAPAEQYLKSKLAGREVKPDEKTLRRWIAELDHDRFVVREAASRELAANLEAAAALLRKEIEGNPSPEARRRIDRLLASHAADPEKVRLQQARRALEEIRRLRLADVP